LDCTSTTGTLQVKILTTDPTATAKVYVRKLAEITWASSAITGVYNVVGPVTVDHGEDMVNHADL
jgi:ABC-type Mn2+/Zn2+ transport system permease subunit